jgi:hypothetical protein
MRMIGQPRGKESQLQIVQETSQQITLQLGEIPKLVLLKKGRVSMVLGLAIVIPLFILVGVFMSSFINTRREVTVPQSSLLPIYLFFLIFMIGLIILIVRGLYSPCFSSWTLDCSQQQIIKSTINLMGETRTHIFPFSEVQSIQVEEHHDSPHALTEFN